MALTFLVGTRSRYNDLRVLLSSLTVQTRTDFHVIVADEGEDGDVVNTMNVIRMFPELHITHRLHDWAKDWHYTAKNVLAEQVTTSKVCFPQDDWYYLPTFVEKMLAVESRFVACDFHLYNVHRNEYYPVSVTPRIGGCSIGNWIIDTSLFRQLLFTDVDHLADGRFVEKANTVASMSRVPEILAVSN